MASVHSGTDSVSTMSLGSIVSTVRLPNGMHITSIEMMQKLRDILPKEDLKHSVTVYKNCFKANDAIETFKTAFPDQISTDQAAIAFGRMIQRARLMNHVCDPRKAFRDGHFFFRLQCYQQPNILNSYRICDELCEEDVMDLLDTIASVVTKVEQQAWDDQSLLVDYRVAHRSEFFPVVEDVVCKLQGIDLGTIDEITRFAAVVDIYNIMIKYAFMKVGVPESNNARTHFFSDLKINIGGDLLSFNDLYHGILRGNRPPKGWSGPAFAANDPRIRLALSKPDPRVHFCLNHTPEDISTHVLSPATIHHDLQREAIDYLAKHKNMIIDNVKGAIHLTSLFKWYKYDFCRGDENMQLLHFIQKNLVDQERADMQELIASLRAPRVYFADFDWGLQAKNYFPFKVSVLKANEKRLL